MGPKDDVILDIRGLTKEFPGVRALSDVSFQVRRGSVHALIGENGAGKSTLIKILTGIHTATSGSFLFRGKAVQIKTPLEALEDLARQFDCIQPVPREDERGRALPAHWPVVLDIRPAYHTADGVTFFPAWLVATAWQDSDGQTGMPWLVAIDARRP